LFGPFEVGRDLSWCCANSIILNKVGGREGIRTPNPLLAKNRGQNTNSFVWCRLHGKPAEFPLSQMFRSCPELGNYKFQKIGFYDSWGLPTQLRTRCSEGNRIVIASLRNYGITLIPKCDSTLTGEEQTAKGESRAGHRV
jgi:hypothetical protein